MYTLPKKAHRKALHSVSVSTRMITVSFKLHSIKFIPCHGPLAVTQTRFARSVVGKRALLRVAHAGDGTQQLSCIESRGFLVHIPRLHASSLHPLDSATMTKHRVIAVSLAFCLELKNAISSFVPRDHHHHYLRSMDSHLVNDFPR